MVSPARWAKERTRGESMLAFLLLIGAVLLAVTGHLILR